MTKEQLAEIKARYEDEIERLKRLIESYEVQ